MYYICNFIETPVGIDINNAQLITEGATEVLRFIHLTQAGYKSRKPLMVDFEYTINEWGEMQVSDEVAVKLIERFKGITYKTFNKPSKYPSSGKSAVYIIAVAAYLGDHGDTSGQFSR
jgi:hypothetical protein